MLGRVILGAVLILVRLNGPALLGDEKEDQDRFIKKAVSAWKERQSQITTIECSAKTEHFYPKDSLSERLRHEFRGKSPQKLYPTEDKRFSDEPFACAIDFRARKIRKEHKFTTAFLRDMTYEFGIEHGLHLFSENKYRYFRPTKEGIPEGFAKSGTLIPDVHLRENAAHDFVLTPQVMPLLWLAGGVTGRWPSPSEMQVIDTPERFKFSGEGLWKGTKCVVLTVAEQDSTTGVREFWVGPEAPYLIHRSRTRDGDIVFWEIDVEYRSQADRVLPIRWTCTDFNYFGNLFVTTTYSVERLEVNTALSADMFEKKLVPGNIVFHTIKNDAFNVDNAGNLIPLRPASSWPSWFWFALAPLTLIAIVLVARRFFKSRFHPSPLQKG